jgi:hypothetical protein
VIHTRVPTVYLGATHDTYYFHGDNTWGTRPRSHRGYSTETYTTGMKTAILHHLMNGGAFVTGYASCVIEDKMGYIR